MKLQPNNAILVGVGSSICGGSAIAATAPVINANDEEVAQSISVIFLFNVIAALIFPALGGILHLSNEGFGLLDVYKRQALYCFYFYCTGSKAVLPILQNLCCFP